MFDKLKEELTGFIDKITTTELKVEQIRSALSDFRLTLIESDVAVSVTDRICGDIEKRLNGIQVKRLQDRKDIVKRDLRGLLLNVMATKEKANLLKLVEGKRKRNEPFVILFVGINGTGKTTSIAKVAKLLIGDGYSVLLACSDTYRPGSIEQLDEHAKRLGLRVIKHQYGADPAAVAYDAINYARARGVNVVLIDTAGRIQTNRNLMNELAKIKRVIDPDSTILTVDALTGNDAVLQAEEFNKSVGIDGIILTKADADVKGGAALSVAYVTGKPIMFMGNGQRYEDLREFDPEQFVKTVLQ